MSGSDVLYPSVKFSMCMCVCVCVCVCVRACVCVSCTYWVCLQCAVLCVHTNYMTQGSVMCLMTIYASDVAVRLPYMVATLSDDHIC